MSVDDEYHIAAAELDSRQDTVGHWGRPAAPRPTASAAAAAVDLKHYTIFACNFN